MGCQYGTQCSEQFCAAAKLLGTGRKSMAENRQCTQAPRRQRAACSCLPAAAALTATWHSWPPLA